MGVSRRDTFPLLAAGLLAPGAAGAAVPRSAGGSVAASGRLSAKPEIRANLGITENPFGPSKAARQAIIDWLPGAAHYPHADGELIRLISEREGVPQDCVHIANGSLEALSLFTVAVARGGRIVAPEPTYATHLAYAARQGIATRWVPLAPDHQIDLAAMAGMLGGDTRLAYVCNPNNPTGLVLDPDTLRSFCQETARTVPVLVDEAFIELVPEYRRRSMASLVAEGHDVVVTRTFSKVYGMAGLRIGYAIARPERVKLLRSLTPTSRNGAGLAAAIATLRDQEFLSGSIAYLSGCREKIYRILEANGLRFLPSQGGYVFVDTGRPASQVQAALAAEGVGVRLFGGAAYANWMRIGTATPAELDIFAAVLPRVLKSL